MERTERASDASGSRLMWQSEEIKPRSSTACPIKLISKEGAYLLQVNLQVSRASNELLVETPRRSE